MKLRLRKRILLSNPVIRLLKSLGIKQYFSQNKEDKIIADYFGNFKGTLLSIGENDGKTYSNVLYFLLRGWKGSLIEPSRAAFKKLFRLHLSRFDVANLYKIAIGSENKLDTLFESGELLGLGDVGIVSTLKKELRGQWKTNFMSQYVEVRTFEDFMKYGSRYATYNLISIDAEGMDWDILQQMDLTTLECKCLVIEHGGDIGTKLRMIGYCHSHGMKELAETPENFIFVK